jgi:streptomycin 6-kinase
MGLMNVEIPARLAATCQGSPERRAWLATLPSTIRALGERWSLQVGSPLDSAEVSCAWVAPVRQPNGDAAVLKVGLPHFESAHEAEGLRFWNGDGAVRLIESDSDAGALLIERCDPGTHLRVLPEDDQDMVIAGLLRRLWRPPLPASPFRPLSAMTALWSAETAAQSAAWPDAGLVREGLELFRTLAAPVTNAVVLVTDLHAGNVLRARREPWLVIDPKPFVGDPAYDVTQHLLNCRSRLRSDPNGIVLRLANLLDLDHERVRLWTFARAAAEPRDNWSGDGLFDLARATAPQESRLHA